MSHRLPHLLPQANAVLLTVFRFDHAEKTALELLSFDTGERSTIAEGAADGRYVPSGHVVYARNGALEAIPFDIMTLKPSGGPVGLVDGVMHAVNMRTRVLDTGRPNGPSPIPAPWPTYREAHFRLKIAF